MFDNEGCVAFAIVFPPTPELGTPILYDNNYPKTRDSKINVDILARCGRMTTKVNNSN